MKSTTTHRLNQISQVLLTLALIAMSIMPAVAQVHSKAPHKNSFTQKDLFQSSVFLENRDIVAPYKGEKILYYVSHDQVTAFFTEKGVIYEIRGIDEEKVKEKQKEKEHERKGPKGEDDDDKILSTKTKLVKMEWIDANPHPVVEVSDKGEGYYTYLKPDGKSFKTLTTEGYKHLVYKNIYPGIDAEYSFPGKGGIEYSLIVHPGANADAVKMAYKGQVKSLRKTDAGDLIIHTNAGDLIEHAPQSFTPTSSKVASEFVINNDVIKFHLPAGYNTHEILTIDPWITAVTTLPTENIGMKVDYDFQGNLFIYGSGPLSLSDMSHYFSVAKYNTSGTFQWAFAGSVPGIWNSASGGWNYQGGFRVDKITGKSFVSQGWNGGGTQTIRLTTAGLYDNFISALDTRFNEAWGIMFDCLSESMMEVGGGTSGNINMGIIDMTTGAVTRSNITGRPQYQQDIVCAASDSAGNMYAVMCDIISGALPYYNTLYRLNTALNGNVWSANTQYSVFSESDNTPYWVTDGGNWHNCLAANGNYLFYYDGYNLVAYSFANGSVVGTPTTIAGYTAKHQGGIAVDRCNNIYLGGKGVIKVFTFNGSTFTPGTDISLGGAYASDYLTDIALNPNTNHLYVAGTVVGTFIATPSIICPVPPSFYVSTVQDCNSTTVHVSPVGGLSPLKFTYTLNDTDLNVIYQQVDVPDTIYDFTNIGMGNYIVQVQWNSVCGSSTVNDTIRIHCKLDSISPDTAICPGATVILSATAKPYGGTFVWTPGGFTDSVITVTPTDTTTYYLTYTPPNNDTVYYDSVTVFVLPPATVTVFDDTAICQGDTATLSASPSQTGGTYLWVPGGFTTPSIVVSPSGTTSYQVTYTARCNSPTGSRTVTVQPKLTLTTNNDTICDGNSANIGAMPSVPGGTYNWSPGAFTTQGINVNPGPPGSYTYYVTYVQGLCSVSDSAVAVVDPMPALSITNDTVCQGSSGSLTLTPSITSGTYAWTPGGFNTPTISATLNNTQLFNVTYVLGACTAYDSALIVVDSLPVLTMTNDSICLGNGGEVLVSPSVMGGTYLWAPGGSTLDSTADSPAVTTTYTVIYTAGVCTVTGSATITVVPQPTVSVTGDTVCSGTPVKLIATPSRGNGTYDWAPGGFQTDSITVSPLTTTTFTITYTIPGCGVAVDSAMIKDWPMPVLTTTDTAFCNGFSGQLSASTTVPGGIYNWSPGGMGTASITVSPTTTSVYTVTYVANGCSATDSATATVHDNPVVQITGANATCGVPNGSETALVSSGASPYTYLWNNGGTGNHPTQLAGNQNYSVTVEDVYLCSTTGSMFISQSTAVAAVAFGFNEKCPGYSDGVAYVTGSGGIPPYTFNWSNQDITYNISGLAPGTYTVTVTDTTGCTISASATVLDVAPDIFTTSTTPTSCYGPQYQDGSLTIIPLTTLRLPYQYSLAGGSYQYSGFYDSLAYGSYNAEVRDDSGCLTPVNDIVVDEAAEGILSISPTDTSIALGQSVQLIVSLSPYTDSAINAYSWSPFAGLSCTDCASPVVTSYAPFNQFNLTITYNGHCITTDSAIVRISGSPQIFIPDVFTPNGDGMNDVFYIYGNDITSVVLKVFNRWGEKVFEGRDQFAGWDGTYRGSQSPTGVYVWEATIYTLTGETIFKRGSVTLVR